MRSNALHFQVSDPNQSTPCGERVRGRFRSNTFTAAVIASGLIGAAAASPALAQNRPGSGFGATQARPATPQVVVSEPNPARETLERMAQRITLEVEDVPLKDVFDFFRRVTGADLEPIYTNSRYQALDPEQFITINARNRPALDVLEQVLERASDGFTLHTWQMTRYGSMQIGPKELLNKRRRVQIYDINDMLMVVPNFPDAPVIDLDSVLQQSQGGGGGGGQSPFQMNEGNEEDRLTRAERAQAIIEIIIAIVEPEQWQDNGGDGGFIRYHEGTLIINAPDYMHRQLVGYSYWPNKTVRMVEGRRYVSLNMDTSISTVDGFATERIRGTAGGRGTPGGPPPGGGG